MNYELNIVFRIDHTVGFIIFYVFTHFPLLIHARNPAELTYFLGLQVKQLKDGIFISQTKYIYDILKKLDLTDCSFSKTPMATTTKLELNIKESQVDIKL